MITKEILLQIAPHANLTYVDDLAKYLNVYMPQYEVNTFLRICHFIAQCAHESDGFKTMTEYASGKEYEGRKNLGNVNPGDGPRYKGRGIIQLTGRANYRQVGAHLGLDLENHPELAETPEVAVRTALEFWKTKGLNVYADRDDIHTITLRVNGGTNGLASRIAYLAAAKKVIPNGTTINTPNGSFDPILAKVGDKSEYVRSLQNLLLHKGESLAPYGADSSFGPTTEKAVKSFQTKRGLPVTGQIDQNTLNALKG